MPDLESDLPVSAATSPVAPAASSHESGLSWRRAATVRINSAIVWTPPNQRLIMRRSASEPSTSRGEPVSVSRSSGTTTRFMLRGAGQLFFEELFVVQIGVIAVALQQF